MTHCTAYNSGWICRHPEKVRGHIANDLAQLCYQDGILQMWTRNNMWRSILSIGGKYSLLPHTHDALLATLAHKLAWPFPLLCLLNDARTRTATLSWLENRR